MKFLPALLTLLLCAAPAHAEGLRASTVFNGCNPEQQSALRSGLEDTHRDVSHVLERIRAGDIEPYWQAWFGSGPRAKVTNSLTRIIDRLEDPSTLILSCEERNCEHDLMGYTEKNLVSVCPDFFQSEPRDHYDSRMGTLVHEFTHMLSNTEDHGYGPGEARRLAAEEPRKAVENADNIEYFVEAVSGTTIRYGTVRFSPENSCQWAMDDECDEPHGGTGACQAGTDTTDCRNRGTVTAQTDSAPAGRRPSFGQANPRDLCATSLNGVCDEPHRGGSNACAAGSDYTDCLTGHSSKTAR